MPGNLLAEQSRTEYEGIELRATRVAARPLINIPGNPVDNFYMTEPEGRHFYTR
jgi:hypothetical protein